GNRWRVTERAKGKVVAERPAVDVVEVDRPVGEGVVAQAAAHVGDDDQDKRGCQPAGDDQAIADGPQTKRTRLRRQGLERRGTHGAARLHSRLMSDQGTPPGPPRFPPIEEPPSPPSGWPPPGSGNQPPMAHGTPPQGYPGGHWLHPLDVGRTFS